MFAKGTPKPAKKGQLNSTTKDIKALAFKHCPQAIAELVRLMTTSKMEATRVAAAKELLDRGIGKASQPITGADEGPVQITHIVSWQKDDILSLSQDQIQRER